MPTWTKNRPPQWAQHAIVSPGGWKDPVTGEIYVAIGGLDTTAAALDTTHPTVTITRSGTDNNLTRDENITLTATFSEVVRVTGTPRIAISINGATRYATYVSGSNSTALTFRYVIGSGGSDIATAGQVTVSSPMQLNSGTIKDIAGNTATLTFSAPSLASVAVDGVLPTISGVVLANGPAFVTGEYIALTATFSEAVTITGTPRIAVTINGTTRYANYLSGTGTTSVVFRYTIVSGDVATAGQVSVAGTVSLNSGTIKDAAGNNATLTFTAPTTSTVTIN